MMVGEYRYDEYSPRKTTIKRKIRIVIIHILICSRWRSLPEIDKFKRSVGAANEHESPATDARVVHSCPIFSENTTLFIIHPLPLPCREYVISRTDHTDAEKCSDQLNILTISPFPLLSKDKSKLLMGRAQQTASAAFPPFFSRSVPTRLQTALSDATAPSFLGAAQSSLSLEFQFPIP